MDRRNYRRQTERRLLWAVIFVLIVVGGGLVGVVYGWSAVVTALLCLVPGALLILALWALLSWVERSFKDR